MKLTFGPGFKGEIPVVGDKVLPPGFARLALNARLEGGDLQAYGKKALVQALNPGVIGGGTVKTVYLYEDDYWLNWIVNVDAFPSSIALDNLRKLYWAGDSYPKKGSLNLITSGGVSGVLPAGSYTLGVKIPTAAPSAGAHNLGSSTTTVDLAYVYTFLSAWGEESGPSPVLKVDDVPIDTFDGGTHYVQLTGLQTDPGSPYNITGGSKNLYRLVVGVAGAEYLFVANITLATTSYNDSITSVLLGEAIPSYRIERDLTITWDEPPAALEGFAWHPMGFFVGWVDKTLYFSEPPGTTSAPQPHAWPGAYAVNLEYPIVAVGVAGSNIYVGTEGLPYIISGEHPLALSVRKVAIRQPCVSRSGFKEIPNGVLYPSADGLFLLSIEGSKVFTQNLLSRTQWQVFNPETIVGVIHDGQYWGFYTTVTGRQGGFRVDPTNPNAIFTSVGPYASAAFSDLTSDNLYLAIGGAIQQFNSSLTEFDNYDYLTGPAYSDKPANFAGLRVSGNFTNAISSTELAVAQVAEDTIVASNAVIYQSTLGEGANNGGALNELDFNGDGIVDDLEVPARTLRIRYFGDHILRHSELINNEEPIRLPSGFLARAHQVELQGDLPVRAVEIATTRGELS